MLIVYSRVTTSFMAERPFFFSPPFFAGAISATLKGTVHTSNTDLGPSPSRPVPCRRPQPIANRTAPTFSNLNPSFINPRGRTSRRLHAATSQHHRCFTFISLRRAGSTSETLRPPRTNIGLLASLKLPPSARRPGSAAQPVPQ